MYTPVYQININTTPDGTATVEFCRPINSTDQKRRQYTNPTRASKDRVSKLIAPAEKNMYISDYEDNTVVYRSDNDNIHCHGSIDRSTGARSSSYYFEPQWEKLAAILDRQPANKESQVKTQTIKPDIACKYCHGSGEVTDWVDYGSTVAGMTTFCGCVEEQADEDTDEIVLDCSELYASMGGDDEPEPENVYTKYQHLYDAE